MTTHFTRGRVKAAAVTLCGIVVIATAACASATSTAAAAPSTAALSAAAGRSEPAAVTAATTTSVPVVVNCAMHSQTRPGQFILACADGGAYLDGLSWAAWGSSSAFANGAYVLNDCVPYCADGHFHSFPVLVALWGAEPRPGHAGQTYFTHLTVIFTGNHSYTAGGKLYQLPATGSYPLSASGGA
jgi:hypothetical protein